MGRLSPLSLSPSLLSPSTIMSELAVDVADVPAVFEALSLQLKCTNTHLHRFTNNGFKCKTSKGMTRLNHPWTMILHSTTTLALILAYSSL